MPEKIRLRPEQLQGGCQHIHAVKAVTPSAKGCEDCLKMGGQWVHLRLCMNCGHVGCCNDSPNKHASKHAKHVDHPVIRSFEPNEDWAYCFADDVGI